MQIKKEIRSSPFNWNENLSEKPLCIWNKLKNHIRKNSILIMFKAFWLNTYYLFELEIYLVVFSY